MRLIRAISAFFKILFSSTFASKVERLAIEDKSTEVPSLQILALLQREGRLVDFLQEDIDQLDDEQIGAAVRTIHKGCRKVLAEQLRLEAIRTEAEGASIDVPPGFDANEIRLIGNVKGEPPFKGVLKHHGWRVVEVRFSAPPQGIDPRVVAPAEVEIR